MRIEAENEEPDQYLIIFGQINCRVPFQCWFYEYLLHRGLAMECSLFFGEKGYMKKLGSNWFIIIGRRQELS